jgi:hypothetical protein
MLAGMRLLANPVWPMLWMWQKTSIPIFLVGYERDSIR